MTAETIRVPQASETPVTAVQRARFGYRYAYARSADSRSQNDPGQDYLVLREDGVRLAFALCDGVSQSFYGDLAARLLGDALVDWLWERKPTDATSFRDDLAVFLDGLVGTAAAQVAAYSLPEDLPPMLREVLEEKRALGSETTFVAGLLDTDAGTLYMAWMGDSRLRLWGPDGEFTARLGDAFHTHERWSTRRGRVGDLHTLSVPLEELRYLVVYSDGLARLDKLMTRHFRDASIQAIIEDTLLRPESDDVSFLEVWLGDQRPAERPAPPPPREIRVEVREGQPRVWWQPVAGAAFYEVRLNNGQSFTVYSPRHALELPKDALTPEVRTVRVRAWGEEPGGWSPEAAIPEALLPSPAPPPARPAPPPEEAPLPFLPTPSPAPMGPPPSSAAPPPPVPSLTVARRPVARPRFPRALFLAGLAGAFIVLLGCLAALLLWPSSPLRGLLFPSPTPTPTATPTPTLTPTPTPSPTLTPTPTPTPSPTPTATFTPTPSPTATAVPTITPSLTATTTPTGTLSLTTTAWRRQ